MKEKERIMKSFEKKLPLAVLILTGLMVTLNSRAATLWTGPNTNFVNSASSDPTQPTNQDRLTADVWITRGSSNGIYNAAIEEAFTHFFSPQNTAWSDGALSNYSSLSYVDWDTWARLQHGGPPNTIDVSAVVHLVSEDIYLSVTFTGWGGFGGGFSWTRSTPQVGPIVAIDSPTNGASFTAPANVTITASANDSKGSVTNVSFIDGATFLGQTDSTPYTLTATFTAGSHALTAVATDSSGLSATSSVVNISVGVANPTLSVTITNPPDNSVLGNTDNINIGADVTDTNSVVTNVSFFDGAVLLRSVAASPFQFTTGPFTFALGMHTLTAVASDNIGGSATSDPADA